MTEHQDTGKARVVPAEEVFAKLRRRPGFKAAYDALEDEFSIMAELIKARTKSGLSQAEIAERMKTTQSAVARLEGMGHRASLATLRAYAAANGHRVKIVIEPIESRGPVGPFMRSTRR